MMAESPPTGKFASAARARPHGTGPGEPIRHTDGAPDALHRSRTGWRGPTIATALHNVYSSGPTSTQAFHSGFTFLISKSETGGLRSCVRSLVVMLPLLALPACGLAPTSGPTFRHANNGTVGRVATAPIKVIDVDDALARSMVAAARSTTFAEALGDGHPAGTIIGRGDAVEISIWEAPPATLFGAAGGDPRMTSSAATARGTTLPEQVVDTDGRVVIPFIGRIMVAGREPKAVEDEIVARLAGKANRPQAIVRLSRNTNTTVTVVGEVAQTARVPLTPKGERLLDILASVGGTRSPITKTTIQIARAGRVASQPLDAVIRDPRQNIHLQPDDVVTATFQSLSFTALGATGRNEEIPFEATGITLAQALGRAAGLQDARADAKSVFIFRFEDPAVLGGADGAAVQVAPNGKVPVIYRINLRDPQMVFVAQSLPVRDKDVLYVSNAPIADVQKFVNVIYSAILPVATAASVLP